MRIVTFTNLYPSAARPGHGLFVERRMLRYAARFGAKLRVVAPVPWFPFARGFGEYSTMARTPERETRSGVTVLHPRVVILPKVGTALAPGAWVRGCAPVLRTLQTEEPIDLLDAHYLYPDGVAAAALAAELRIPFVLSARGTDVNVIAAMQGPRARILDAASRAAAVIAVSQALADRLAELGVDKSKLAVVRNGVDVDRFRAEGTARAEGRVLLGVGRLVKGKGFAIALESMARLLPEFPDLTLVLAGEGPEREPLSDLARRLGCADRLRLLGEVPHDRIPELLRSAHRFVLPSFNEGYPNVVVEAIAAGVPVVATRVGGIPEIVDPPVGDLASDGDFTQTLGRSLRRTFDPAALRAKSETFRWEPILDLLDGVFRRATAGR